MLLITSFLFTDSFTEIHTGLDLDSPVEEFARSFRVESDMELMTVADTQEKVLELAAKALAEQFNSELYRFDLKARWIPRSILSLTPAQILTVNPTERVDRYTTFNVRYKKSGKVESTQIQLVVAIEKKLPVVNQRVPSGETISEGMLGELWVSISTNRGQLVENTGELIGYKVRRTLAPGQPIRHADVTKGFVVISGETVRLIFNESGVRIEIEVVAQSSGEQDEEIIFFSEETRNRYLGRISGPGVAIWRRTL